MAAQVDKTQHLENQLKEIHKTLTYYEGLFKADTFPNSVEQKQLGAMQAVIQRAEAKLVQVKAKKGEVSSINKDEAKKDGFESQEEFETAFKRTKSEINQLLSHLGIST